MITYIYLTIIAMRKLIPKTKSGEKFLLLHQVKFRNFVEVQTFRKIIEHKMVRRVEIIVKK